MKKVVPDEPEPAGEQKLKKRRNRNKKKTDHEIALNNFMRQVAGDNTAAKKPAGKNEKGPKKAQPAKTEKADQSFDAKRKDKHRREQAPEEPENKSQRKRRGSQRSNQSNQAASEQCPTDFQPNADAVTIQLDGC